MCSTHLCTHGEALRVLNLSSYRRLGLRSCEMCPENCQLLLLACRYHHSPTNVDSGAGVRCSCSAVSAPTVSVFVSRATPRWVPMMSIQRSSTGLRASMPLSQIENLFTTRTIETSTLSAASVGGRSAVLTVASWFKCRREQVPPCHF